MPLSPVAYLMYATQVECYYSLPAIRQMKLSGSLWLRQPVEDLRFDLGISFYGFTRCSWTIPNLRKSPFVIRALLAPCAAVAVR